MNKYIIMPIRTVLYDRKEDDTNQLMPQIITEFIKSIANICTNLTQTEPEYTNLLTLQKY